MTRQFITNKDKKLAEVINNILPACDNLHFLVGYFYFSGFEQIHEQVQNKKLRILVGLEIERDMANRIREYEILENISSSRSKLRDNYCTSLIGIFNETDFFDSHEKQQAFRVFLGKIHDGTLEIRKTLHSNHAKLYVFENAEQHNHGGEFLGTVITGSSNLTRSGLRDRFEINVVSRDNHDFNEALGIFNQLWDESVIIVDENSKNDFLINANNVIWTLTNLDGGVPETIAGAPQADRVDFYFTRDYLKDNHSHFPTPNAQRDTNFKLSPTNSSGTERKEGKRVRIAQPVSRFYPIDSVVLTVNKTPAFEAHANNAYLHLDIETGPAKYYGSEIFEVHFGIEADYLVTPLQGSGPSQAQLIMSHEMYATVLEELKWI